MGFILRFCSMVIFGTFAALQPAFAQSVEIKGRMEVIIVDDFKNKKSHEYAIIREEKTGKEFRLRLKDSRVLHAGSGRRVKAKGRLSNTNLLEAEVLFLDESGKVVSGSNNYFLPPPALGIYKTAFILIKPSDRSAPTMTPESYKLYIADKVAERLRIDSFNQALIDVNVFGYFNANATASQLGAGPAASLQYIGDQLIAAGIDVNAYDKVVFAIWGSGGGVAGLTGRYATAHFQNASDGVRTAAHEFSHTLGLYHSPGAKCRKDRHLCEFNETTDFTDVMGYDMSSTGYHNAVYKERLGWLNTSVGVNYRKVVTASGTYTIKSYNSGSNSPEILKIPASGINYYIEYRRPVGYDSFLSQKGPMGPTIHIGVPENNFSFLVADVIPSPIPSDLPEFIDSNQYSNSLILGRSYRDQVRNVSFRLISMNDIEAQVEVRIGNIHPEIPFLSLLSPSSDKSKYGLNVPVEVSVSATSAVGIANVEFYKQNGTTKTLICSVAQPPFKCVVSSASVVNQSDNYVVVARDVTGLVSRELPLVLSTDNSNPICQFSDGDSLNVVPGSYLSLVYTESDNGLTYSSSRSHKDFYLNGQFLRREGAFNNSVQTAGIGVPAFDNGTYTFQMRCFDKAGNMGSDTITLVAGAGGAVNLIKPAAEIDLRVSSTNAYSMGALNYTITNPLNADPFSYASRPTINGQLTFQEYTPRTFINNYNFLFLAPVGQTISVSTHLIDPRTGTKGPMSSTASFVVGSSITPPPPAPGSDTAKPSVSLTAPLANSTIAPSSSVVVSASASDNVGVTKVEFYVGGVILCTDTSAPYSCTWSVPRSKGKTYTLEARAHDQAGNVGTHSILVNTGSGGGGRR